jgi:protein-disulfide isomerase
MHARETALVACVLVGLSCKPSRVQPATTSAAGEVKTTSVGPSHCKALRERICAQFGASSDECRLAEKQVERFSLERCLAMLSRYDEMARSAARFVAGVKALTSPRQDTPHGPAPSIGSPGAPITMVLFADFDSPACSRGAPIATAIRNVYRDRVRLVFRQFPLSGNADSHLAAEASLAAHAQGKFWPYYDVMFGNPQAHDRAALERYAGEVGLDMGRFRKALDDREFAADVDADYALGVSVDVTELSALFVNGTRKDFPYGVVELSRLVDEALAAGR